MHRQKSLIASLTLGIALLLCNPYQPKAYAQVQQLDCSQIRESKDFPLLASLKGTLSAQIQELKTRLASLPSEIDDALAKEEIDSKSEELDELEAKTTKTPSDVQKIEQLKLIISISEHSKEYFEAELRTKTEELAAKERLLQCVEQRIANIWTPEQSFKLWMSLVGAALIFLVISGFFVLSFRDEAIRRAIFSGQTGIQFLTLFSIVIAIILFGITGVLQDKELAALLGGLSGYILGRYSNPNEPNGGGTGNSPSAPTPPAAQPPAVAPTNVPAALPPAQGKPGA